jgi:hypothetical protein
VRFMMDLVSRRTGCDERIVIGTATAEKEDSTSD